MTQVQGVTPSALASAPLLRGATGSALVELAAAGRELKVEARAALFEAGDAAEHLYVVLSGRLQVLSPDDGRVLREVGPGGALGELGLLTGSQRSATVRALRDSRLLELDAERFVRLVESDGGFALSVARELARQLQESGGLALAETKPSVFTVVGAGSADAARFARELAAELARWGSVAMLDGAGLEPEAFGATLERAERDHAHVVLGAGSPDWDAFCRRQCDRLLVVASGAPPAGLGDAFAGCELVLLDAAGGESAPWLDAVSPRAHHVVAADDADRVARVARRLTGRSLGVVLSGGGARGFAHIGALIALADAGFEIDRVGGCSMGSFIAALAALGRSGREIEEICTAELVRRSPFNDYTLPRVALIRSRKAAAMLERVFGEARVEETTRPLFTVSADLLSSRVVVHRRGPVVEAVGASMSIPGVAPPVRRAGRLLVDGGVLNNLPVDHMAETGEGPIVAVDVIRRLEMGEEGEPSLPTIAETLARATVLGSVERAERNRALALVLVAPHVEEIGLRQWSAIRTAVDEGRRAATETLESGGAEALAGVLQARA